MEFRRDFPVCKVCGSEDTISRLACAGEPSIPEGTFTSLEKMGTPIQDITKLTTPVVKTILVHYDACAECGTRRCTRAEVVSIPSSHLMGNQSLFNRRPGKG